MYISYLYVYTACLAQPAGGPMSLCRGVASVVCPSIRPSVRPSSSVHISRKSLLLPQFSTNLNRFQQDSRSTDGA